MKVKQIRTKSFDSTQPHQTSTAEPELGTVQPHCIGIVLYFNTSGPVLYWYFIPIIMLILRVGRQIIIDSKANSIQLQLQLSTGTELETVP
jgi:hypothetical protein